MIATVCYLQTNDSTRELIVMRLLSISGGIVLATVISLASAALLPPVDAKPVDTTAAIPRDDVPDIVLQAMSWWYFNAQIARAQLPENPAAHYLVIDLRAPKDFARGHLPGAVNVPADQVVAQLGGVAPDHDKNILLVGYDETHSVRSLATLRLLAYTHVMHLTDGWQDDGAVLGARTKSISPATPTG